MMRRRWRRRVLLGALGVVVGGLGWVYSRPARPFYGRWGYGGVSSSVDFRRSGVLLTTMCVGVDYGLWRELRPGVLRVCSGGEGPVYVRWRVSADGKSLFLQNSAEGRSWGSAVEYPRTGSESLWPW